MKRLLFIYNPHAGKELLKPKLADVIDIFVKAGYEVVAYPTQAYRDAYKKIKKYDSNEYDLVVCSGGDGTLDEVVTGMMKRDRDKRDPIGSRLSLSRFIIPVTTSSSVPSPPLHTIRSYSLESYFLIFLYASRYACVGYATTS